MVIDGRRRDDDMKIGRSLGLSMVISEGLRSRFMNGVREPVKGILGILVLCILEMYQ